MAWPLVVAAVGSSLLDAWIQTENLKDQQAQAESRAKWDAAQFRIKQSFLEMKAEEALYLGDKEAQEYRKKVSKFKGQQRATLAAQGISVDSGTAADLQQETADQGALDVLTIKNNAFKEAFGMEQEALSSSFAAQSAEIGGKAQASAFDRAAKWTIATGTVKSASAGYSAEYRTRT